MLFSLIFQFVMAFFACVAFSIIFNAPKKELPYCGICGSVSWGVYFYINEVFLQPILAAFVGTLAVTILCRHLSFIRSAPSTMYHIAGILPLVPGMNIYNAMSGILSNDMLYCFEQGVTALKFAAAIATGSILILSLPQFLFQFSFLKHCRKE